MPTSIPRLPLNTITAFRTVAELQNLRAAAEVLHLTHSAVSQQIGVLEQSLGFDVFDPGVDHFGGAKISGRYRSRFALSGSDGTGTDGADFRARRAGLLYVVARDRQLWRAADLFDHRLERAGGRL